MRISISPTMRMPWQNYETYTQTVQVTNELPGLPVSVLGPYSLEQKVSQETVAEFHSEGKALQTAYTEANERYETLMTAPKKRSGGQHPQGISNVDDILTDMSLDKITGEPAGGPHPRV